MMADDLVTTRQELKSRFFELWESHLEPGTNASPAQAWDDLERCYSASDRYYHTLSHVAHSLAELDQAIAEIDDPQALEMAIWFHDVIYKPGAHDNEHNSAELFARYGSDCFDLTYINCVKALILSTTHDRSSAVNDEKFICDIDLSSLGLPWEKFHKDSQSVRAERGENEDPDSYLATVRFLKAMLERPAIFQTEFFNARYERRARENIQQYINQLNGCPQA